MKKLATYTLEIVSVAIALAMLFWPVPVDQNGPLRMLVEFILTQAQIHPSLHFLTYYTLEKTANVLLFIPLGFIVRRHTKLTAMQTWLALTAFSILAELAQKYIITARVFAFDDIIANSAGCLIGALIYRSSKRGG